MNIFIIQGKSGIYPGIWMSRAMAEADREMVACAGVSGDVIEMVPASESREKDEMIGRLADWIRGREVDRRANAGIEMKESKTLADDFMRDEFGLRKVGGTWERCK